MAKQSEQSKDGGLSGVLEDLPTDELKEQARDLMSAVGERAIAVTTDKLGSLTERLADYAQNSGNGTSDSDGGGLPGKGLLGTGAKVVKDAVTNKVRDAVGGGGGGGGGDKKTKATNIIEQIEIGVPVRVAYNQWTQFQDFPKFTKRIESVEQESDEQITWKAGIYFSHRTWKSTIVEQVPDERIVWHSQGDKGYIDGTVTFHEIGPNLTKILLVLEYHPQGLFERTGNAFRSQRRRARLELHHFDRHVMRQTILEQDEVEGWRGEIRDSEVVRSHEDALEEEEGEEDSEEQDDDEYEDEDAYDDEYDDQEDDEQDEDDEDEDEDEEAEDEEEDEDDDLEDEYEDEEDEYEDEDDEDEDEAEPDEEEDERPPARSRRRKPALSR